MNYDVKIIDLPFKWNVSRLQNCIQISKALRTWSNFCVVITLSVSVKLENFQKYKLTNFRFQKALLFKILHRTLSNLECSILYYLSSSFNSESSTINFAAIIINSTFLKQPVTLKILLILQLPQHIGHSQLN